MLRTSNLIQLLLFAGLLLFSAGCRKEREPKVKTLEVVEITSATAKGGGQVLNEGGGDVMQRGLVWDTVLVPSLEKHSGMSSDGACLEPHAPFQQRAVWRSTDSKRYGFSVRCVME